MPSKKRVATRDNPQSSTPATSGDAEAIRHLEQAIAAGKHWYIALLEAIGLWASTQETYNGRFYRYLIAGEAFDWLLLAERLCESVNGLLPEDGKLALLFNCKPPLELSAEELKALIGTSKYRQHLNYYYGVTVETALLMAVQVEVRKEWGNGYGKDQDCVNETYRRIYENTRTALLKQFRQENGYPQTRSISITELKEFTYWLFKYRLAHCDPAKVASDTKKALALLKGQGMTSGFCASIQADLVR
ncbi:MAG: hypothetical protein HYX79_08580 [Chloroflexi bacterium]|nr:hypothetical protein [Chloroflexota bacterium]